MASNNKFYILALNQLSRIFSIAQAGKEFDFTISTSESSISDSTISEDDFLLVSVDDKVYYQFKVVDKSQEEIRLKKMFEIEKKIGYAIDEEGIITEIDKEESDFICSKLFYHLVSKNDLSDDIQIDLKKKPTSINIPLNQIFYGPPGTGKTETAKIMGKIFSKMGILKRGTFKKATRSDLVAGYLGQTALKTRDLIKECLGGVLFIDEAYALGNPEKRDSFAKEAIDTLCEGLSDHKKDLMVIIAGYEDELKSCFFNYNAGLESRFTWRFKTDDYKPNELMLIFKKKVLDSNWSLENDKTLSESWFEEKMPYFKYYGRDMETLFSKCKIAHSRRVFCKPEKFKTVLNKTDLDKGFKIYTDNDEVKQRKKDINPTIYSMYC